MRNKNVGLQISENQCFKKSEWNDLYGQGLSGFSKNQSELMFSFLNM